MLLGGVNSAQMHSASRENGVTAITYRRTFNNLGDEDDIVIPEKGPVSVIWAMGKMAEKSHRVKEPSFHHTYTRQHTQIDFNNKEKVLNVFFTFTSVYHICTHSFPIHTISTAFLSR